MAKKTDNAVRDAQEGISAASSNQILEAVAAISCKESTELIAEETASALRELTEAEGCVIFRWQKATRSLTKLVEAAPEGYPEVPPPEILLNYTVISERLRRGTPLVFQRKGISFALPLSPLSHLLQAGLLLPLLHDNQIIGLVVLYKTRVGSSFSETQVQIAKILGAHAAVTLLRAEVMREASRRAEELDVLWHTRLSTNTGKNLKEVLNLILESALGLFSDATDAHIFLYDGEKLNFGAALWADIQLEEPLAEPRENGLTYQVARSGEMVLINDVQKDPLYAGMRQFWEGAVSSVPLKLGGKVTGVMNLWHKTPRTFSKNNLRILNLLADQAAVAISRAEALNQAQQRTAELEAVWQVSLSLTGSLDLKEMLYLIMEKTMGLFSNAENAHIFLVNDGELEFGAALYDDGRHKDKPYAPPRPDGITVTVAHTGELLVVPDMRQHPLFKDTPSEWKGAIISVPLAISFQEGIDKEVVGVMNVSYNSPRQFPPETIRILKLLADQAAVAISRAKSLHETRLRVRELEALRKASLSLNASLDLENVVDAILNATLKISEDTLDVHLFLNLQGSLEFAAAKWSDGLEHEPWVNLSPEGLTYMALRREEPVVVPDINLEDPNLDGTTMKAIIALPLKAGNEVVAVMNVAYKSMIEFEENYLRVLSLIGDQAALAIANVMLHQTIRQQAMTDALTQIPNRRTMEEQMQKEYARAKRRGNGFVCAIADLDNFKRINDTFGHACGDAALIAVANIFKENIRINDHVGRWGGEEFYFLLPETTLEEASILFKRIRNKVREFKFEYAGKPYSLSITLGYTAYEPDEEVEETLRRADQAMYEGKAAGKNMIVQKQTPPMKL